MNYFYRLLCAFATVIFVACSSGESKEPENKTSGNGNPEISAITEKTNDYSITYEYNEGVIVLDDKAQSYIEKVEKDSILFFSPNTPSDILPDVGDVLSSKITDKLPNGLGNVVVSKTSENGLVKCVTSIASLDDIFKTLELSSDFSLTDLVKDEKGVYDEDGNYYEFSIKEIPLVDGNAEAANASSISFSRRASIGSLKILEIPLTIENKEGLFTDLKLQIGGIITFDKNINRRTFENSLEISVGIQGEFGLKGEKPIDKNLTLHVQKLLDLIKRCKILEGNLPIAGGIINLRPFVDFEANLIGGINGKISVGAGARLGYKCGWNEKGRISEFTSTDLKLENIINSFSISGKAEIGPEVVFHLGCGVWTRDLVMLLNVKPSIVLGAELGISGEKTEGKWQIEGQSVYLDASVDVDGELAATIFGKEIYKQELHLVKFNLLNLSLPIFPQLEAGSFNITQKNDSPLLYSAQYTCTGGFLAKLLGAIPSIRVEKAGIEVYHCVDAQDIHLGAQSDLDYELTGLEMNQEYMIIPCLMIGDVYYDWSGKKLFTQEKGALCPDNKHPHLIDLGLPNGMGWSCYNVGAKSPEDYGGLYCFGEPTGTMTTTNSWGWQPWPETISGTSYDIAKAKWGDGWRLPTYDEAYNLLANSACKWEWITYKGTSGYKVTGPSGNSIFLPAGGSRWVGDQGDEILGKNEDCCFWLGNVAITSENNNANYYGLYLKKIKPGKVEEGYFTEGLGYWAGTGVGMSIRPVKKVSDSH